jgi:hypothetical protein
MIWRADYQWEYEVPGLVPSRPVFTRASQKTDSGIPCEHGKKLINNKFHPNSGKLKSKRVFIFLPDRQAIK